ncbi:MAG: prepilin peptidase [Coprococcus sp.]|nr:prepilin peptidase [Coprococcus sp.]
MREIAKAVLLVYLMIGAVADIRIKKVPVGYLAIGTCGAILCLAAGRLSVYLWAPGILTGGMFLLFSKCSKESIGYGDSWMILNLGILLGIWELLAVLGAAFLSSAVAAGIGTMSGKWNRKTRIPFYPFLTLGYLGVMLW